MCHLLPSIKCAEPNVPPTLLGNMNRHAPVATNFRETRLVAFTVEDFETRPPLCTPKSTEGPKAFSLLMLFNVNKTLVIDACCGEAHRYTTKQNNENLIARSTTVPTPVLDLSRSCFGH